MTQSVIDTGITESDILAELVAEYRLREKQPGEFTLPEFMAAAGIGEKLARNFIREKIERGELLSREVVINRGRVIVYRKASRGAE